MATKTEIDADIEELLKEATKSVSKKEDPYKLILYNDDNHDVLSVSMQIQKAIKCNHKKAVSIMMMAHKQGQAIVIRDTKKKCEKAEAILNEVGLGTKVEKE